MVTVDGFDLAIAEAEERPSYCKSQAGREIGLGRRNEPRL